MGTPKRIFTNRTLNLRSIKAIGYDMDYTLIHYEVHLWEALAYEYTRRSFEQMGWPVEKLEFQPDLMIRGLVIDKELGNVVKANRFGFVKRALHGTRPLQYEQLRKVYSRVMVDLAEPRWAFMNTLFSLSEACLFAQLVELLDSEKLPGVMGYEELYRMVRKTIDHAHMEGKLKGEIMKKPERFVVLDQDTPLALLDQKHAGKELMLITNSGWPYTNAMMRYAFDPFLPKGQTWRDLFSLVIVEARKPSFFTQRNSAFEIATEEGLLRPSWENLKRGGLYYGADAEKVQRCMGMEGDEILYVGDHIFSDLNVSKNIQRWRTGLILRELEQELESGAAFEKERAQLEALMAQKEGLELELCQLRLQDLRRREGYGPPQMSAQESKSRAEEIRAQLSAMDEQLSPLAKRSAEQGRTEWGSLMRAGNDKSHLARQIERYADIYMAKVGDFLHHTPYAYLRSSRGSLPHD